MQIMKSVLVRQSSRDFQNAVSRTKTNSMFIITDMNTLCFGTRYLKKGALTTSFNSHALEYITMYHETI